MIIKDLLGVFLLRKLSYDIRQIPDFSVLLHCIK
nr:MAG TPA: hypothetical protein [Caudoviricetes sp.]